RSVNTLMCSSSSVFLFSCYVDSRDLHSFPTRRSSDLGLLEGTLQAGTSAVSDKLLDLVGLGGKSAADKGKDTRDYQKRQKCQPEIGRAVQQECRDRSRMPSSA